MFETFALQTVIPGPIFILKKELMKIPFWMVPKKNWCYFNLSETATRIKSYFF